mmetsp:Transcript_52849/g.115317  ORF Transcript_52849/g.115317 Transcript_52849/m.115317 type:complete len:210 (+) Transcript_52849:269-898(+)
MLIESQNSCLICFWATVPPSQSPSGSKMFEALFCPKIFAVAECFQYEKPCALSRDFLLHGLHQRCACTAPAAPATYQLDKGWRQPSPHQPPKSADSKQCIVLTGLHPGLGCDFHAVVKCFLACPQHVFLKTCSHHARINDESLTALQGGSHVLQQFLAGTKFLQRLLTILHPRAFQHSSALGKPPHTTYLTSQSLLQFLPLSDRHQQNK